MERNTCLVCIDDRACDRACGHAYGRAYGRACDHAYGRAYGRACGCGVCVIARDYDCAHDHGSLFLRDSHSYLHEEAPLRLHHFQNNSQ